MDGWVFCVCVRDGLSSSVCMCVSFSRLHVSAGLSIAVYRRCGRWEH